MTCSFWCLFQWNRNFLIFIKIGDSTPRTRFEMFCLIFHLRNCAHALKIFLVGLFLMLNNIMQSKFQNSKILHFLGIKSESHHWWEKYLVRKNSGHHEVKKLTSSLNSAYSICYKTTLCLSIWWWFSRFLKVWNLESRGPLSLHIRSCEHGIKFFTIPAGRPTQNLEMRRSFFW